MTDKTVWVTKYALSSNGRIEVKRVATHQDDGRYVWDGHGLLALGKECHETLVGALEAANAARTKKIAALRKQITNLESMEFKEA